MKNFCAFLLIIALLGFAKSCDKSDVKQINHNILDEYVSAYTGGVISRISSIDLELMPGAITGIKAKAVDPEWLSLKPKHKGSLEWKNDQTLSFRPEEPLKSGELYEVSWNLPEIFGKKLGIFSYNLRTPEQRVVFKPGEVKSTVKEGISVSGALRFNDYVKADKLQDILSANISGEKTAISIASEASSGYVKSVRWSIKHLKRKEVDRPLQVNWDASGISASGKGEWELNIPAQDKFEVLQVKHSHAPNQAVSVWFSGPVKKDQNLKGLVQLEGTDIRYQIDDNILHVYPKELVRGQAALRILEGIENTAGKVFTGNYEKSLHFDAIKPEVRLLKDGVVLPSAGDGLFLPFETVNLAAVDVYITKIYANNIHQFLQVNNMNEDRQLRRVGKNILRKTIELDQVKNYGQWSRHHLNLNDVMEAEKGAIYRVAFGFRKKLATYNCGGDVPAEEIRQRSFDTPPEDHDYWKIYEDGYFPYSYRYVDNYWQEKDDPCKEAFYRAMRPVEQNLLASDMGMLAQKDKNEQVAVMVSDLLQANPIKNATVTLYDYQNQELKTETTDAQGLASFKDAGDAFLAVGRNGDDISYLKLGAATQQNLSNYAIGGKDVQNGLKGFIYGERGVWRPGDSIYTTFILREEREEQLPEDHPVVMKFYSPQGELMEKQVQTKSKNGFHVFPLHTSPDAPTGNWQARVEVGGTAFTKNIRVETVKPNRLKINLDVEGKMIVEPRQQKLNLEAKWLHGAKAPNLKAKVELTLAEANKHFTSYKPYTFRDNYKDFETQTHTLFDGETDETGRAVIQPSLRVSDAATGVMKGYFFTKVFEPGGNFSVNQEVVTYHPYMHYVGFRKPDSDRRRGSLLTGQDYNFAIQTLRYNGKRAGSRSVRAEMYKLKWRWWWESNRNRYNYANRLQEEMVKAQTITTNEKGKANWNLKVNEDDWGRYLVRFIDTESGHVASQELYFNYPGWWRELHKHFPGAATRLSLSLEDDNYNVGETATAVFPGGQKARAFITIENGTRILQREWIDAEQEKNRYQFKVSREMIPNIYVHVNLIQPHSNTLNDMPIRMYGIVPAGISEPETHLHPEIVMPDELETGKTFNIRISERDNREMTYTLAVVDEGLLDLTNFTTPDPWKSFFAREALGVETWDMYDWVIGAFGGKIGNEIKLGGDMRLKKQGERDANRFEPVVKFLGPFTLKSGSNNHKMKIEDYVGSVRAMVISGSSDAYGHSDKTAPVTKPLMLLGTLPRVLGPGEVVELPVSVFASKAEIKDVEVSIETGKLLEVAGKKSKQVRFDATGEKETSFKLRVAEETGVARVHIRAGAGKHRADYKVELDVRNPNPYITNVDEKILEKGEQWEHTANAPGIAGTNSGALEVSTLPALNLEYRLNYLMRYPHGCVEQVVSAVFPQLYLDKLTELTQEKKQEAETNIRAAIKRLRAFQDNGGGMSYWPGRNSISEWGTNYAGHFLLEAGERGYSIPGEMLDLWKSYQKEKARKWVPGKEHEAYIQAYRLYTLALAGETLSGPMNRLYNSSDLNDKILWRLAAAYAVAGKERAANKVIAGLSTNVESYRELGRTYGSGLRDKAMILETLLLLDKQKDAFRILKDIAGELSENKWLSTQETAYALMAASFYAEQLQGKSMELTYTLNGKKASIETEKAVKILDFDLEPSSPVEVQVTNNGGQVVYTRVITRGKPATGKETTAMNGIGLQTDYMLPTGEPVNPRNLEQGTDFYAKAVVRNDRSENYQEIALSQVFPSGWEIINQRMFRSGGAISNSSYEYRDIRDDRVYTYFDLNAGQQKVFYVLLNASYQGTFYMPAVNAQAMYDNTIFGRVKGFQVEVIAD